MYRHFSYLDISLIRYGSDQLVDKGVWIIEVALYSVIITITFIIISVIKKFCSFAMQNCTYNMVSHGNNTTNNYGGYVNVLVMEWIYFVI